MMENMKRVEQAMVDVRMWADMKQAEKPSSKPYTFPAAFVKDFEIVKKVFAKETLSHDDKLTLVKVYKSAYHTSGKIEGITSCDSSAHGCEFCNKMRKASEKDPTIICGYCYDYTQEERWWNTYLRHSLNLAIMTSVEFTREELQGIDTTDIIRINSSGDTENVTQALNMINIIYNHPDSACAYWTKNVPAVDEAIDRIGKPKNMIYIQSSIHINKPAARSRYADYVFTVYTADMIEKALADGAMECNGKKCMECGYKCYHGLWPKGSDIAEKLRT